MPDNETERAKSIADLRAFADLVESNPAIPAPNYGSLWTFIHAREDGPTQDERFEQIHDFAETFGVPVTADHDGDRTAKATFGLITLRMHAYADKKPAPHVVTRPGTADRTWQPEPATL